jgi:hypothetical protein
MSHRRLLAILLTGACLLLATLALSRWLEGRRVPVATDEVLGQGRWHRVTSPDAIASESEHDRAQLLSSPYLAGTRHAERYVGVTVHDPERAQPGHNFYVSGHAAEAFLIDRQAQVLARWALPLDRAFPDSRVPVHFDYWRRAQLLPDGGLIALYQGVGLVRIDRDSRLVWAHHAPFFNDLFVAADGRIYTLAKRPTVESAVHPSNEVLEDSVVILDEDGKLLRSISLLHALLSSEYAELLHPIAPSGDVFHSNTVTPLGPGLPAPFSSGLILVSIREIDLVALLDPATETFVWAQRGPWSRQHEPVALPTGALLVFDNRGGDDGLTRVLETAPLSGDLLWQHDGLNSPEAGSVQRLPNGNTLITESERGRAIEITHDGELVWELWSPHRAGRDRELVATLFDVHRLPIDCCPWLSSEAPSAIGDTSP